MAKKRMKKGLFITFEGPEGCGKSTHAKLIYEFLKVKGYDCVFTREPGGTLLGEKIRDILLNPKCREKAMSSSTELLLFEASRSQILEEVIKPALGKKKIVICDRFNDSTIVYQGYAGGVPLAPALAIDSYVVGKTKPDLTIMLDIDTITGLKRAAKTKTRDRMERKSVSFHERVRNGFKALAEKHKNRIRLIGVRGSIEETQSLVKAEAVKLVSKFGFRN